MPLQVRSSWPCSSGEGALEVFDGPPEGDLGGECHKTVELHQANGGGRCCLYISNITPAEVSWLTSNYPLLVSSKHDTVAMVEQLTSIKCDNSLL